jgi:hypothetical protein
MRRKITWTFKHSRIQRAQRMRCLTLPSQLKSVHIYKDSPSEWALTDLKIRFEQNYPEVSLPVHGQPKKNLLSHLYLLKPKDKGKGNTVHVDATSACGGVKLYIHLLTPAQ